MIDPFWWLPNLHHYLPSGHEYFLHIVYLCTLLRFISSSFGTINTYAEQTRKYLLTSSLCLVCPFTLSLHTLFCVFLVCSIIPSLMVPSILDSWSVIISLVIFFSLLDCETFLQCIQMTLTMHWESKSAGVKNIICFATNKYAFGLVSTERFLNLFLRVIIFGLGANCGVPCLSTISLLCLVQNITYVAALMLILVPGSYLFFNLFLSRREALGSIRRRLSSRVRSKSMSASDDTSSYPERHPVTIDALLHQRSHRQSAATAPSSLQKRVKYLTLLVLCCLHVHNRTRDVIMLGTPSFESLWENRTLIQLRTLLLQFLDCSYININFILLIIAGFLIYHRARLYENERAELYDLSLDNKSPPPPLVDGQKEQDFVFPNHCQSTGAVISSLPPVSSSQALSDEPPLCRKRCSSSRVQHTSEATVLEDDEILDGLALGRLKTRQLEKLVGSPNKAVELRRTDLCRIVSNPHALDNLPFSDYDYRFVHGQCCEEVIGYLPLPVGKVGPLLLDGRSHYIPLATTEGCLVASTNRGCRAIFLAGGVKSVVFRDQMTRAPVVWFPSVLEVVKCIAWLESDEGFQTLKAVFDRTSSHISLLSVFPNPSGHYLHIRFSAQTGEAMGMNMVSKATDFALHEMHRRFPSMQVISLSGNMCTDKKPATINNILGRGKSVIAETCLPATILAQILHTSAARLARLAMAKNWMGSAMAGCPGMMGSNAHAANIVAGLFAAMGQDLAQVIDSSACLTHFEVGENDCLIASVTMPCLEVGTFGGGTRLPAQRACLDLLDLSVDRPTEHLARLIAGTVLAGELSLMSALDTDDLVSAHMRLNRTKNPPDPRLYSNDHPMMPETVLTTVPGLLTKSDASGRLEPPHPIM